MREILDADILFLSLCPLGKNGLATLYKSETEHAEFHGLTKALDDFDEKGLLAAVVWTPGRTDSEGDFASAATVEKMAHSFLKNGGKIDLVHNCKALPVEAVHVAESFIIQKGDPRFAEVVDYEGNPVDATDGWGVVLKINDPALRKAYREGEWAGVSMYGPARVRTVEKAKVEAIRNVITKKETEDMKPEEIQALIDSKVEEALAKAENERKEAEKAAAAEAAANTETVEKTETPEIDLTNPEAVREHAKTLAIEALKADVDWKDPKAVAAYADAVEKIQKGETVEQPETTEEVEKAEKAKRAAASNLSKGAESGSREQEDEEGTLVKAGTSFAAKLNKQRGF